MKFINLLQCILFWRRCPLDGFDFLFEDYPSFLICKTYVQGTFQGVYDLRLLLKHFQSYKGLVNLLKVNLSKIVKCRPCGRLSLIQKYFCNLIGREEHSISRTVLYVFNTFTLSWICSPKLQ